MTTHLVLFKPRPDLAEADRRRLLDAFERAVRDIPLVRQVRVGRRVIHGAGYEAGMPDAADYLVEMDFDDVDALRRYLEHPSHGELGTRFNDMLSAALIYDFDLVASGASLV